jgi:phenylpyruvate tautomerase PptA (4-oxalocrotonate tautomerase family)
MSEKHLTRRETLAATAATAIGSLSPGFIQAAATTLGFQEDHMPLIRFDLYEGRSDKELKNLLDTAHSVMVEAFKVPARDRYQIVNEHRPSRMIMEDTGLNIPRTNNFVMIQITTRPRTHEMKEKFYKRMAEELEKQCGVAPSDVMMNFVTCTDEDWSFGLGRAQFLTKEL